MPRFTAKPGAMALGANIIATVEALGAYTSTGYRILAENGITNIKPDEWYPMQAFCSFFEALDRRVGASVFYIVGRTAACAVPLPPEVNTVEKALSRFDSVYKTYYRGGAWTDGWKVQIRGDQSAKLVFRGPFPDDFVRGLTEGFIRRFARGSTGRVTVRIDAAAPRRDRGESSTTLLANW
jgi:hypothetical protein